MRLYVTPVKLKGNFARPMIFVELFLNSLIICQVKGNHNHEGGLDIPS